MARHVYSSAVIERNKHDDSGDSNQILHLSDKDQQDFVFIVSCTAPGSKSAIYDCLVIPRGHSRCVG